MHTGNAFIAYRMSGASNEIAFARAWAETAATSDRVECITQPKASPPMAINQSGVSTPLGYAWKATNKIVLRPIAQRGPSNACTRG